MSNQSDTEDIPTNQSESSDVEEEQLTLAQAMQLMEESWLNEKFAPEILPNKQELVECLLVQILTMEENVKTLPSSDFQKAIFKLEADRLCFLISSYLRIRVEKIETYCYVILQEEALRAERGEDLYLTKEEMEFAKDYKQALEEHFNDILKFWPGIPPDDWKNEPAMPNLKSFVFLKSKSDIEGVVIDDGRDEDNDLVDFKNCGQMIISYNSIGDLVKKGDVHLI